MANNIEYVWQKAGCIVIIIIIIIIIIYLFSKTLYFYCNLFCYLLTYLFTYLFFYFLLCINVVHLLTIKKKLCLATLEKVK